MPELQFAQEVAFVAAHRHLDETTVLAQAIQEGMRILYRETVLEGYLAGQIPRDEAIKELGLAAIKDADDQREAFQKDILWGLADE
jgi:hypothetical protein